MNLDRVKEIVDATIDEYVKGGKPGLDFSLEEVELVCYKAVLRAVSETNKEVLQSLMRTGEEEV